jgi:glycogen debranching enzyme
LGICSWRNIIEEYNLTGAVTEINAECYHALLLTGKVARKIGCPEDAERYTNAAEALKDAINSLLVSEQTRLYALNIDRSGEVHHDITGDLVFPVLFEAASPERTKMILKTLTTPEMWTPWGVRTVHPMNQQYDPEFGYQLVGGVWPNLTAWISFCLRMTDPEKMVEGMINIYKVCESKAPIEMGRVVPGEFPERFHGERCVSLGMPLSPWTPPTYTWLGVEGLLGATPSLSGLELNPSLPAAWGWIAVRNLLYRGERIDAFLFGGILYATRQVTTRFPLQVGVSVRSSCAGDDMFAVAIRIGRETMLFVCSDAGGKGTVQVEMESAVIKKEVQLERGGALLIRLGDM